MDQHIDQPIFRDRRDAGRRLAARLRVYADDPRVLVLGLPRGGVPVAFEVARALRAPLDVFVVRKLGAPGQRELAMGAIASGGVRIVNEEVVRELGILPQALDAAVLREQAELERQELAYRGRAARPGFERRTAIVVDDGLATGSTMRAAVAALRLYGAGRIVVAVPVGAADSCRAIGAQVDEMICLSAPESFRAVSLWYREFGATPDEEVRRLLESAATPVAGETVRVLANGVELEGALSVPLRPRGAVLFAHGSGSSRRSPRNRVVAGALQDAGFATLLMDLLTSAEQRVDERTAYLRFNIEFLSRRLTPMADWLGQRADLRGVPQGLFGASTGAAAALVTASERPGAVRAVVSRGGRPDLAEAALPQVQAPTLLIVGAADTAVIGMNREAMASLRCKNELRIVAGAGHLFEEPGSIEIVAELALGWFERWLIS